MASGISRRGFLGGGLAAAAGLFTGFGPRRAHAAGPWGDWPAAALAGRLPERRLAKNVLEVFFFGGLSPWESFYTVDEDDYGKKAREMWWTFADGPDSVPDVFYRCVDRSTPLFQPFARDANGTMVKLGPFADPLRRRPDILARTRMLVVRHDQVPHETAIPLTLTGYRLGSPKMAGVGAAVQHHALTHAARPPAEPFSYMIRPQGRFLNMHFNQGTATGLHPAFSRPLTLHGAGGLELVQALNRHSVGRPAESDALLAHYTRRYRDRLRWKGGGEMLRAPAADDYAFAADALRRSGELLPVLEPGLFKMREVSECGTVPRASEPEVLMRLATHLLKRPGSEVKHVTVVDAGYIFDDFGYDTHLNHVTSTGPNMMHGLKLLCDSINRPGERDPAKIDLDETLVVLNTEFGRSPAAQSVTGRNHHPAAYVILMFGGPVGPEQRGIVGAIEPDGRARDPLHPVETRAAVLSALDIYPFAPEAYAVGDVGAESEAEAAIFVRDRVLGVGA